MTSELNTRIYVVEVPGKCAQCGNLPYHSYDSVRGCCIYSSDSPVHDMANASWVSVYTTEDHTDAVSTAKEYPRARVRQFWVAKTIQQRDTLKPNDVIVPDAPLLDYTCKDHNTQHARATSAPTCPECSKAMWLDTDLNATLDPIDWTKGV